VSEAFETDEHRWSGFMAAALGGDSRRYEQLLRELAQVIESYIKSRFGSLCFTEDCVQECLLAIHTGRHTYDPSRPFRPWMFTIVRNKTVDLLRRSYAGDRAAAEPLDESVLPSRDTAHEVVDAGDILAKLQPQFRSALTLTKVFGYSVSEAAAQIGISESAMKSRVSRAVRAAEALLEQEASAE